jgi:hypothetical protein
MGYINHWELKRGKWVNLGTALIKNANYNTIGSFPHDVLALPTTTGFMIDDYADELKEFLAAEFLESLLESIEDEQDYYGFVDDDGESGEDYYGFIDDDDDWGEDYEGLP